MASTISSISCCRLKYGHDAAIVFSTFLLLSAVMFYAFNGRRWESADYVVLAAADVGGRLCLWTRPPSSTPSSSTSSSSASASSSSSDRFQLVDSISLPSSQIINSVHLMSIQQQGQRAILGIFGGLASTLNNSHHIHLRKWK